MLLVLVSGACADIPEIMELKTEIKFLKDKMMNQEDNIKFLQTKMMNQEDEFKFLQTKMMNQENEFKFLENKMMTEIGSLKQQITGNNDVSNHPSDSLLLK